MQRTRGSTRLLLVGVLSAAAVLLGATLLAVLGGDDEDGPDAADDAPRFVPDATSRADRVRVDDDEDLQDDDDIYDEWAGGSVQEGLRDPEGPTFTVTQDSLRRVLADRHWEETRRQIDVLQHNGEQVSRDVVETLITLLDGDDTRIDAVLALGDVRGDEVGQMLSQRAGDVSAPFAVRNAALDAIAANGSAAALPFVQSLLADPDIDPALARHAFPALAGIGGAEAARTLVAQLRENADGPLRGSLVTALGKTEGAGEVLAQTLRDARDNGNERLTQLILVVGQLHGEDAAPELRSEVRRVLEDPSSLQEMDSDDDRLGLRVTAMVAASAMGGGLLDPVIAIARDDAALRSAALHSLRQARGDDAARNIAVLLDLPNLEDRTRDIVAALGETRSREATRALVTHLDDDDGNVRQAAAHGLGLVRDPASVEPILKRLAIADEPYAIRQKLVDALGVIGDKAALPLLEKLMESDAQEDRSLMPFVRRAIHRIKTGRPESTRMESLLSESTGTDDSR